MKYMLLPYEQHSDNGLGAIGDEFEEAGCALGDLRDHGQSFRLTRCYLFRHAIELYLKSAIIILHRGLKLTYGSNAYDGPGYINLGAKWTAIHNTHSVGDLWSYLNETIKSNREVLKLKCRTNWEDIPEGLSEDIAKIEELDRTGTFFRYPGQKCTVGQPERSAWRETNLSDGNLAIELEKPLKIMLMLDDQENVTSAFRYHDDTLTETLNLLEKTAAQLTGLHVGLRHELMDGW